MRCRHACQHAIPHEPRHSSHASEPCLRVMRACGSAATLAWARYEAVLDCVAWTLARRRPFGRSCQHASAYVTLGLVDELKLTVAKLMAAGDRGVRLPALSASACRCKRSIHEVSNGALWPR